MDFKGLVAFIISSFIQPAVTLIFAAAVVFFLWNIMQVILKSDQPDELAKFKDKVVWGIIAIAVMASMWGLVNFVIDSFKPHATPAVTSVTPAYNSSLEQSGFLQNNPRNTPQTGELRRAADLLQMGCVPGTADYDPTRNCPK